MGRYKGYRSSPRFFLMGPWYGHLPSLKGSEPCAPLVEVAHNGVIMGLPIIGIPN